MLNEKEPRFEDRILSRHIVLQRETMSTCGVLEILGTRNFWCRTVEFGRPVKLGPEGSEGTTSRSAAARASTSSHIQLRERGFRTR